MAKFISFDGVDAHGVRAEVTVMTGTGTISEIIGRGKQNEDGTYRNMEVVFNPDNPMLKRKVYGLVDTTATELWQYIQEAHESQKNISYRIESQRRNGVDRTKPIGDLVPTEDIRRILAAIDGHFSHEAKTNPAEDPSNENPSALAQAMVNPTVTVNEPNPETLIDAVTAAITANPSLYTANGSLNYGAHPLARAAHAERFALNHLVSVYTPPRSKTPIEITDEILGQASSLASELVKVADEAHNRATKIADITPDNESRRLALDLVIDAVDTRHPAPLGSDTATQNQWRTAVAQEAADRLVAISRIAASAAEEPVVPRFESTNVDIAPSPEDAVAEEVTVPLEAAEFVAPSDQLVNRVRLLCEKANLLDHPREISDWIEASLGERSARKVHAPHLQAFVTEYEKRGSDAVRAAVLGNVA